MESDEDLTERELLTQFLRHREHPCPTCGYTLRGITTGNCPECGRYLSLQLASYDLLVWPWMLMMTISLSAVPFTVVLLSSAIGRRGGYVRGWEHWVYAMLVLLCAASIVLWSYRRKIVAASRRMQLTMVGAALLLWCAPIVVSVICA